MNINGKKGYIVLIGGAEDKKNSKDVLSQLVKINQAGNIVVIPTASGYPRESFEDYRRAFNDIGVMDVHMLDIRYRDHTKNPAHISLIEKADIIFFTGGDQEKLVKIIGDTLLIEKIREQHAKGVTIAGSSAGASAIGNPMIAGGNGKRGFHKGNVRVKPGFGFLDQMVIDTHFMERSRIPRLTQALSGGLSAEIGIGLSEDTAVFIGPEEQFMVIGSQVVTVLNNDKMAYSNYTNVGSYEHVAVDGIRLSFLTSGMVFDLKRKQVRQNGQDLSVAQTCLEYMPA